MVLNPALILLLGALPVPWLRGWLRAVWMLALPVAGMVVLWSLPEGRWAVEPMFGIALEPLRIDGLSRIFATVFHLAAFIAVIYGLNVRDTVQQVSTLAYAGAAVGGALAGDLVSFFICWELAGLTSVFLILARRTERAYRAGMRYLVAQVFSGLLLLAGIVLLANDGQPLTFNHIGIDSIAGWLILIAIGTKCAFPVLHAWLQDTYPEATVLGTVVLSAFTTKLAIYALARGYAGTDLLIWVGAAMTCFPIFYAVIENDLRRVLAYSMINQLGFMVVGIGIGGALGVNGAAAHAFADILFKGLLFMSMGAVLLRTGTINGSELGGLYKSMPQTAALCMVGAASISAFPLFSGFVTKSMIVTAVAEEHLTIVMLMLLFASAGVFHHAGIKIPFFAFFAHDRGYKVEEAPLNMRVAMLISALLCIGIGCMPELFYKLLPYPNAYEPYTTSHVVNQVQILLLSAMAFTVLMRTGIYPPELRSVNIDFDWFYRKAGPALWRASLAGLNRLGEGLLQPTARLAGRGGRQLLRPLHADGRLAADWSTSMMVAVVLTLLALLLALSLA